MRRGKWREVFGTKGLSALRQWVLSPAESRKEDKSFSQNPGNNGNRIMQGCLTHYP